MTPTPDTTIDTAAPLTAEQIAEIIRLAHANTGSGDLREWTRFAIVAANSILPALAENAALRDRLARAEESLRAIGALAHAGLDVPEWDMVEETLELIERHVSVALRAAPTDGAARAGDAT